MNLVRVQVHSNSKLSTDILHTIIQALPAIVAEHLSTFSSKLNPADVSTWDCSTSNHSRPSHDVEIVVDFTSTSELMRIFPVVSERIGTALRAMLPPGIRAYVWLRPQFEGICVDISTE